MADRRIGGSRPFVGNAPGAAGFEWSGSPNRTVRLGEADHFKAERRGGRSLQRRGCREHFARRGYESGVAEVFADGGLAGGAEGLAFLSVS